MNKYAILVSDIDGTLLDNQGYLPQANIKALQSWVDQGLTLILATGRNLSSVQRIIQAINRDLYLILQDGGLVMQYPSLQILSYYNLKQSTAQTACNILQQAKQSFLTFDSLPHGHQFTLWQNGSLPLALNSYLKAKPKSYYHHNNKPIILSAPPSKIVTINHHVIINPLYHTLKQMLPSIRIIKTQAVRLNAWFLEVGPVTASKLQGLETILTALNCSLHSVIAIGDAQNDFEIIQAAGLGIAMGNASSEIKAVAKKIIGSNNQAGVAQFLQNRKDVGRRTWNVERE